MFCENCGKELENDVKVCPACGAAVEDEVEVDTSEVTQEMPQQEMAATEVAQEMPQQEMAATEVTQEIPQQQAYPNMDNGKKPSGFKNKLMAGVAIAVAAVVVVTAGVAFAKPITRALVPEKAYRNAEKQYLENIVEDLLVSYDKGIDNLKKYDDTGAEIELSLSAGESVLQLIDELSNIELEKNTKIGLKVDYGVKENRYLLSGSLLWGTKSLFTPKVIVDAEESEMYLTVPELDKHALLFDIKDLTGEDISDYTKDYRELMGRLSEVYPKSKMLQKMMSSYLEAALEAIEDDNIEHSKTELKAGKVKQKCTEYKITLDAEELAQVGIAFLEAMLEDERVEELMVAFVDAIDEKGFDGDDAYKAFEEEVEWLIDELENAEDADMEIEMLVYLGSDGEIYGREIKVEGTEVYYDWYTDSYKDYTEEYSWEVSMLTPESGKQWALELEYSEDDITYFELNGEGTKSGKKRSGELKGEVYGADIGVLQLKDVCVENALRGELSGTFTYLLGELSAVNAMESELKDLAEDLPNGVDDIVEDIAKELDSAVIKLTTDCTPEKGNATVSVMLGEEELLSCTAKAVTSSGEKVKIPSDAVDISDEDDLLEWAEDIAFDEVLKQLEKKGLPEDLVDILDELIELYLD